MVAVAQTHQPTLHLLRRLTAHDQPTPACSPAQRRPSWAIRPAVCRGTISPVDRSGGTIRCSFAVGRRRRVGWAVGTSLLWPLRRRRRRRRRRMRRRWGRGNGLPFAPGARTMRRGIVGVVLRMPTLLVIAEAATKLRYGQQLTAGQGDMC